MVKPLNIKSDDAVNVRIESIDVLRGITILVMIFVNDLAGVHGTPPCLKHHPTLENGMTFVDVVFPAFLFIVGMSMPFSIGRRLDNNPFNMSIIRHILIRVFGLLLVGFFMVNGHEISSRGILNPHLWILLSYLSIIIIWNKGTDHFRFLTNRYFKYSAIVILIGLALIYTGEDRSGFFQMRTHWWEILGLIGWAYLVACLFYIPFRKSQFALLGAITLLLCFYLADEAGLLSNYTTLRNFIHPSYTLGSHPGIILLGAVLGSMLKFYNTKFTHKKILCWSFGYALFLFVGGILLNELSDIHIMFSVSKNLGTVPWALKSSAFTIWVWMIVYWLIDVKGFKKWICIIKPAGANPLFAYILAPIFMEIFILISILFNGFNFYVYLGRTFVIGLFRALVMALSMTWLSGYLNNKGLRLKL